MIEHATVLRSLLADEEVTFHGRHYRISDLPGSPRPATPGGPPFLVGGGAPRVLRFAGGFADIVGVNASIHSGEIDGDAARDGLPERIDRKVGWVREGAGERFDDLELNAWLAVAELTDDRDAAGGFLSEVYGVPPAEALASPLVLVGDRRQVADELRARRERWGYSYTCVPQDAARDLAPVVADLSGT
jgi:alkanesulfonate monooxygenase SsuD/methylene tetrahydromethanopterin reductase-like flavin-dependent oxidoreductase (luciferase family)